MGKAKSAAKTVANAAGTAYNAATSGPFKLLKAGAGKLFGAAKIRYRKSGLVYQLIHISSMNLVQKDGTSALIRRLFIPRMI